MSIDLSEIHGYKPRIIEPRFWGMRRGTWGVLALAALCILLAFLTYHQVKGTFDVSTDVTIHEQYEGQTLEVCAKKLAEV